MAELTISFQYALNESVQVGDTAYYVETTASSGGFTVNSTGVVEIGTIKTINAWNGTVASIVVTTDLGYAYDGKTSEYILFSKDNKVNLSSILGYYAEVKFRNNSKTEAELFSIGCEVAPSSK